MLPVVGCRAHALACPCAPPALWNNLTCSLAHPRSSLKPRHYALGLYLHTLSWQNMLGTRTGVLQLLGRQHTPLFELLGRTSGRDVDKLAALAAAGVGVTRRAADGIPLLVRGAGG